MGRRRKEWDSEYKEILGRIPGASSTKKRSNSSTKQEIAEIKEWRYLVSAEWEQDDWSQVERVIVDHDISDVDRCPICLESPPVAPRLSRCGHIFCLLCLCKYQDIAGSSCPLCQNSLYAFKPLVYSPLSDQPVDIDAPIELSLFARSRFESTVVDWNSQVYEGIPWDSQPIRSNSHVRARPSYLKRLFQDELDQLNRQFEDEDARYYERAIELVTAEISKLGEDPMPVGSTTAELYYYFYQPIGRHRTFLDPLDIKILVAHFTTYANFPAALTTVVRNIEYVMVDQQLKSKSRYLDHLPVGTVIRLISCDWTSIASDQVLAKFEPELKAKHVPKSPTVQPAPHHPEQYEQAYQVEELDDDVVEDTEYLYDRASDNATFGDYLPDFIPARSRNGRKVISLSNTNRRYR